MRITTLASLALGAPFVLPHLLAASTWLQSVLAALEMIQ
jgi:hypothetical protein